MNTNNFLVLLLSSATVHTKTALQKGQKLIQEHCYIHTKHKNKYKALSNTTHKQPFETKSNTSLVLICRLIQI